MENNRQELPFQFLYQPKYHALENQIIGYEILLRSSVSPYAFPEKTFKEMLQHQEKHADLLEWKFQRLTALLEKYPETKFSLNIDPQQFFFPETLVFFQKLIPYTARLSIELTEAIPTFQLIYQKKISAPEEDFLIKASEKLHAYGFSLALDDVDSGQNTLELALQFVPFIDSLKFSIIKCKKDGLSEEATFHFLDAWSSFADEYKLDIIVEGIEDEALSKKVADKGLDLQQGYFWGKPSFTID